MRQDFEQIQSDINEYEEGTIEQFQKSSLKESLVLFNEKLFHEDITEGLYYMDEKTIEVSKDSPLPQLFMEYDVESPLTGNKETFIIKEIQEIHRGVNESLIFTVLVSKPHYKYD
jgi:hypothetical protein